MGAQGSLSRVNVAARGNQGPGLLEIQFGAPPSWSTTHPLLVVLMHN